MNFPRFAAVFALLSGVMFGHCAIAAHLPEIIGSIKPSIVGVGTSMALRSPRDLFRGTGFVVADGYHVITNAHVLPEEMDFRNKEKLVIFYGKGEKGQLLEAKKIAEDMVHDLALLKISRPMPAVALGDDAEVLEGADYAFTGFPLGLALGMYPVTHRAIVSAVTPVVMPVRNSKQLNQRLVTRLRDPYMVYQLDGTAYPGNSGSPVYERETGKVIGVVNSVFVKETKENLLSNPSGITYAIPVRYVKKLLDRNNVAY